MATRSRGASNTEAVPGGLFGSNVVLLQTSRFARAFELLAAQPVSLAGLTKAERDMIVVSAVAGPDGVEHPLSRFGDAVWLMSPSVEVKNRKPAEGKIVWPADLPTALVDDAKAAIYSAFKRGRHSGRAWGATTIIDTARRAKTLLKHLASHGIANFSALRPLYLSDLISELRSRLKPTSIRHRLEIVDLVWAFPSDVLFPLQEHPWPGTTLGAICGCNDPDDGPASRTGKTPVIPRSVQQALLEHCESTLAKADAVFAARDAGELSPTSTELIALRNAAVYVVQITSGMRNSETAGLTNDCWRVEEKNGTAFHWVRTREVKTGAGDVDFLVPHETFIALEVLKRYAQPLQQRLAAEVTWLNRLLDAANASVTLANGMRRLDAIRRISEATGIMNHMLLGVGVSKDGADHEGGMRVGVLSGGACGEQLKRLAKAAGTTWPLANHQCRRTFAFNVANSKLGRMGLVFLRWQLKHSSLSWTQLYASNPLQDQTLYREFEDELVGARLELLEGWMDPNTQLAGGAGRKLMATRATPARDLPHLLRMTAESLELRSTGHAWCLSGTRGCHGQGIYDAALCGNCSQAVIDPDLAPTWQMIHLDNLRLAAITDCGPAVSAKAQRAIERSTQVLLDLGVELPGSEEVDAYMNLAGTP